MKSTNYRGYKFTWTIGREVTCSSTNIVYLLQCNKENGRKQYIGETSQELWEIIDQHIGYVRIKVLIVEQQENILISLDIPVTI